WYTYAFRTPAFPDYQKIAVHATLGTASAFIGTTAEQPPALYAFDRRAMLRGEPASFQRFTVDSLPGFQFQALTPADLDGAAPSRPGAPPLFLRHRDEELPPPATANPAADYIDVYALEVDFADPSRSKLSGPASIAVSEFDSSLCRESGEQCLRQPHVATRLD